MPSPYIIETGRSYPNPVDSEDYDRTYTSDEHPSFGSGYQIEVEEGTLDQVHMHLAGMKSSILVILPRLV